MTRGGGFAARSRLPPASVLGEPVLVGSVGGHLDQGLQGGGRQASAGSRPSTSASSSGPTSATRTSRRKTSSAPALDSTPSTPAPATTSTAPTLRVRGLVKPRPWLQRRRRRRLHEPGRRHRQRRATTRRSKSCSPMPRRRASYEQPNFLHTTLFAEIDYRDVSGQPEQRRLLSCRRSASGTTVTLDAYDFRRLDVEANQCVPLDADKTARRLRARRARPT